MPRGAASPSRGKARDQHPLPDVELPATEEQQRPFDVFLSQAIGHPIAILPHGAAYESILSLVTGARAGCTYIRSSAGQLSLFEGTIYHWILQKEHTKARAKATT